MQTLYDKYQVPMREIAVLTPYTAQRDKITMMVKGMDKILSDLKVACTTDSQGTIA